MPSRSRSCSRGYILRRSYSRRNRTSRKRSRVASTCIKDRGLPGKGPYLLPTPKQGALSRFGYFGVKYLSDTQRHRALRRAIKAYGFRKTIGHLVLIANYTRRSDPAAYAIFKYDQMYVSKLYKAFKSKQ